jgi:hypothetical protein
MRFGNTARVFIVVKTYPQPLENPEELVCLAGVTDSGLWVRLSPLSFRGLDYERICAKYQWVEVVLEPAGHGDDNRKESRRPKLDTLTTQGEPLSAAHNWRDRRAVIDPMVVTTLRELRARYEIDGTSLGIVRPTRVHDIEVVEVGDQWSAEQLGLLGQVSLFDRKEQPLRKIPFEFRYVFECEDDADTGPQSGLITDWELGAFYFKEERRLGDGGQAAQSVRSRFLHEVCGRKMEPLFFMGTSGPHHRWTVLGVFYPERDSQLSLLD